MLPRRLVDLLFGCRNCFRLGKLLIGWLELCPVMFDVVIVERTE